MPLILHLFANKPCACIRCIVRMVMVMICSKRFQFVYFSERDISHHAPPAPLKLLPYVLTNLSISLLLLLLILLHTLHLWIRHWCTAGSKQRFPCDTDAKDQ